MQTSLKKELAKALAGIESESTRNELMAELDGYLQRVFEINEKQEEAM